MTDETKDNVSSLKVARFHKNRNPDAHEPVAALDAAYAWIKELGDAKPDHIIVAVGRVNEDGNGTRYFQAGSFRYHAQIGLMLESIHLMREAASED